MGGTQAKDQGGAAAAADDKPFADSMMVVVDFWQNMGKEGDKRREMLVKLYDDFFAQHPEYEHLFAKLDDAPSMITKLFDTLVKLLESASGDKAHEMIDALGKRHANYGVPAVAFDQFIGLFEKTLADFFPHLFNARTQFCFAATLNFLAANMIDAAEKDTSGKKEYTKKFPPGYFDNLDVNDWESFASNDLCLHYLHLHMLMLLSSEITLFLRDVLEYSNRPTKEHFEKIKRTYVQMDAPQAVNLTKGIRDGLIERFNRDGATKDLFAPVVTELGTVVQSNLQLWSKFKDSNLWTQMMEKIEQQKAGA